MRLPLVHKLAYSWTGWPKSGVFPHIPAESLLADLDAAWSTDGLTRISHRWTPGRLQVTFRANPDIAPMTVAARAKGRLDHAFRKTGWTTGFSRKVGLRSLGDNTMNAVLAYIATQLDRADLIDPRYVRTLSETAWQNPDFDLSEPSPTAHGRYWYDIHLVAVTDVRYRVGREDFLDRIRPCILDWGKTLAPSNSGSGMQAGVRSLAVMHDHLHLAFRGPVERSPANLAEDLWQHLNRAAGCRLFSDKIYVGTFSEYPLGAIVRGRED